MIPAPGETAGAWWEATGQAAARAAYAAASGAVARRELDVVEEFFHDVPQPTIDRILAQGETPQSATPFGEAPAFTGWPDVPIRVLAGRDDRLFPAPFQRRVAQQRLGIEPDVVPGGHLLALAHPVALAERLVAYWEGRGAGGSAPPVPGRAVSRRPVRCRLKGRRSPREAADDPARDHPDHRRRGHRRGRDRTPARGPPPFRSPALALRRRVRPHRRRRRQPPCRGAQLAAREERRATLDIRPLSAERRQRFGEDWAQVQADFGTSRRRPSSAPTGSCST